MVRLGIVGMGIRGEIYANTIAQNENAKLIAISDMNIERLEKLANEYNVEGYVDYKDMLSKEDLDALIIATPDHLHKDIVIAATKENLHIMVEKPFATNVEDAKDMYLAIQNAGVKCLVAFENRWNPVFLNAYEFINKGEIGEIITINSRINNSIYVPTKMLKWSKNASPGWFLLPHSIDMACWLTNKTPESVFAVGTKKKLVEIGIPTYDSIQSIVRFDDETNAVFTTSWILPESLPNIVDYKFEIIGSEGTLYIDTHDQMLHQVGSVYKHIPTIGTSINGKLLAPPNHMLHGFIDNIRLESSVLSNEEDGLLNTRIIDSIHESIILNKQIYI